jgi:hypothetical protein
MPRAPTASSTSACTCSSTLRNPRYTCGPAEVTFLVSARARPYGTPIASAAFPTSIASSLRSGPSTATAPFEIARSSKLRHRDVGLPLRIGEHELHRATGSLVGHLDDVLDATARRKPTLPDSGSSTATLSRSTTVPASTIRCT